MLIIIFFFPFLFQLSHSTTILVDGVSEWKNPIVHIGDSIIFKHKYGYNLYIFQNEKAFNLCNFTQASFLNKPDSTSYTWHPSRPGFFYFSFKNGSLTSSCEGSQKLAVKVFPLAPPPQQQLPPPLMAAPVPSSGGVVGSSPAYPWPFQPHQVATPPSLTPSANSPVSLPSLLPDKGEGNSMPFINSNPAVPLPTGEVDSATIRPIQTSAHRGPKVMPSLLAVLMALFSWVLLLLL